MTQPVAPLEQTTNIGNGITVAAYLDLDPIGEGKYYAYASNGKATFAHVGPCDTLDAATKAVILALTFNGSALLAKAGA